MKAWLRRIKRRRFDRQCDKLGIPSEVRERAWRAGFPAPDWYAGRGEKPDG